MISHKLIKSFVFLLALIYLCSSTLISQPLKVKLALDQGTLLQSQSVWITATIQNNSQAVSCVPPTIFTPGLQGIAFTLNSSGGKNVPLSPVSWNDNTGISSTICIPARDSISQAFDILGLFSNSGIQHPPSFAATLSYLTPGEYIIRATIVVYNDTFHSNNVRFTVKKPESSENSALRLLQEAEASIGKDNKKAQSVLERFIREHPASAYTPQAYGHLISLYHSVIRDLKKTLKTVLELANRFPDNGRAEFALATYAPLLLKEKMRTSVSSLAGKYPGSKVGKRASSILRKQ